MAELTKTSLSPIDNLKGGAITPIQRDQTDLSQVPGINSSSPDTDKPGLNTNDLIDQIRKVLDDVSNGVSGSDGSDSSGSDSGSSDVTPGTEHYTGYDSIAERIRRILDNTTIDNLLLGWTPDSNLSNEDNLKSLSAWLDSLFTLYSFQPWKGNSLNFDQQPYNYASVLQMVYKSLSNAGPLVNLSDGATLELAEKIADMSYSYINQQFMAALSYQSWYLQQEYNSPVNQVNRLAEAGLNSAFVSGQFSAGNAQQAASVPMINQPGSSNAGQAEILAQGNRYGFLGSILQAGAGLITGGGSALASLISAQATKKLSAKQIQLSDSEIINNAATYEMLRAQYQEILQNQAYKDFDKQFELSQQSINQAAQRIDSAKLAYDTALHSMGDVEVQGFQTLVRDKSGHTKTVNIDYDETLDATKNYGYLKSGDRIVGSESWENMTRQELDAAVNGEFGFGVPGIGKVKAGASVGTQLEHRGSRSGSDSKEQSKERQEGSETGQQRKQYNQGYDESGRTYRIGESLFTSVTIKRPMSLTANKVYLDKCLKRYESALEEYNTLSTGERARLCDLLDHIQQILGKFSSRVVHTQYMSRVNSLLHPRVMVGD